MTANPFNSSGHIRLYVDSTDRGSPRRHSLTSFSSLCSRILVSFLLYWFLMSLSSLCSRVLVSTTQPAHVIALVSVLVVATIVVPSSHSPQQSSNSLPRPHPFTRFSYLCAFSLHIGSQFWMTFMSGKFYSILFEFYRLYCCSGFSSSRKKRYLSY